MIALIVSAICSAVVGRHSLTKIGTLRLQKGLILAVALSAVGLYFYGENTLPLPALFWSVLQSLWPVLRVANVKNRRGCPLAIAKQLTNGLAELDFSLRRHCSTHNATTILSPMIVAGARDVRPG